MGYIHVDLSNTNNKLVGFRLANVDTFIIRVEFRLTNVNTIHTLIRHKHDLLTQIITPTCNTGEGNTFCDPWAAVFLFMGDSLSIN